MDHFFQMEVLGGPEHAMLDSYTTLGFLAANTSTVQLGALVTGVIYVELGVAVRPLAVF
jgi:alkanesulfonate monooxygenase SsuD/methylene tetrahydromethanopterin reductase-like flavin-dependent oxidoreductase (luciferase family)